MFVVCAFVFVCVADVVPLAVVVAWFVAALVVVAAGAPARCESTNPVPSNNPSRAMNVARRTPPTLLCADDVPRPIIFSIASYDAFFDTEQHLQRYEVPSDDLGFNCRFRVVAVP